MIMFHQDESFVLAADVSAPLGRAALHRMASHKLDFHKMDSHKLPPTDPICTLPKWRKQKDHPLIDIGSAVLKAERGLASKG